MTTRSRTVSKKGFIGLQSRPLRVPAINILLIEMVLSDIFTLIGAIGILNGTVSGVSDPFPIRAIRVHQW
jgi:hypothetical protein